MQLRMGSGRELFNRIKSLSELYDVCSITFKRIMNINNLVCYKPLGITRVYLIIRKWRYFLAK
jgi:hypothetical protein